VHRVVDLEHGVDILAANRKIASENRRLLEEHGVRGFDFLGSIGSGKTLIIEHLVEMLKEQGKKCGVVAGDVAGDDDYRRFSAHGIPVVNVNTGKECHLDAHLVDHALEKLPLADLDFVFIENVGNLVCPADFPLGTEKRVVVISVTEGDDMVRKHPLIFSQADVIVLNKIDLAEIVGVDPQVIVDDAKRIAPHVPVIFTSAKTGEGLDTLSRQLALL